MDTAAAKSQSRGFGFSKLSEGWGTEMVRSAHRKAEMCEEKRLYYRVISGASVSDSAKRV